MARIPKGQRKADFLGSVFPKVMLFKSGGFLTSRTYLGSKFVNFSQHLIRLIILSPFAPFANGTVSA